MQAPASESKSDALWRIAALALPVRLLVLLGSLGLAFVISRETASFTQGPVLCLFRIATGLPCPFCGTTRSIGSLVQGDVSAALAFNPLGVLVLLVATAMLLLPRRVSEINRNLAAAWWRLGSRGRAGFTVSSLTLLWLFNLPRMF